MIDHRNPTPNEIKEIFVFGSNLAGRHGAGSAKEAIKNHGAIYGQGRGLQDNSYAIPTKDAALKVRTLEEIKAEIHNFNMAADYARRAFPNWKFNITRIGCGLAGYDWEKDIRPLFPETLTKNCQFIDTSNRNY